ncbi:MAG: LPS assembly lipoprotein LptE [Bacteroidia bacterium]|nr:LPS assembly lipoprotein LptE [Bacteroidia bacterium]MCX7764055.1 LPS assembly lipoprotein LptE [Bacteroidia bacterium]MDW8057084.1 LptE family protein [Bacteroidia bacterium]
MAWKVCKRGFIVVGFLLAGCAYSFRSGALPPDVRSITVSPIQNEAAIVIPTLAQTLAEALRQKFISQSPLTLTTEKGDLILHGRITDFKVAPVAIQGTQQAAQNRLSITVHIRCVSPRHPELGWEQSFMNFADFPAAQPLAAVQEALISDICDRIAQDVVNKTLSFW